MTTHPNTITIDHPGSFILEELDARGWAQVDLAYILGILPQHLNPILNGKMDISPDMAVALGEAFDMPAEFFANLQKLYDLQRAKPVDPGVKVRATWASKFPVREMIRRGWIEETEPGLLDLQMLRFFEEKSIDNIPFVGKNAEFRAHVAKKTDYSETTPIQYVWLYRVRKIARRIAAPKYSEDELVKALPLIRRHMLDPEDFAAIPHILRKCGIRFVLVEPLPSSKIDGVCVWLNGEPVIGMTTRLDRLDNFCFVLRHEIEHVICGHGRAQEFMPVDEFSPEDELNPDTLPEEERIANEAASEYCVPQSQMKSFIARKSPFISEKDVLSFSARMEINPAVIVGQIQRHTKKWAWLRKYQTSARKHLLSWDFVDGWNRTLPTDL